MGEDTPATLGALRVDETKLRGHVDEVVRSSVEETLNALDVEADQICRAQRYERSPERLDGRAGHYERKLETKAGQVTLRVPKLRSLGTVSRLNQKTYRHIEAWRNREIVGEFPYVYLDGVILKRSWAGEVRNISVLVAIGIGTDGFRQILGVACGGRKRGS